VNRQAIRVAKMGEVGAVEARLALIFVGSYICTESAIVNITPLKRS